MKVFRRISMCLLTLIMLFSCVTPVSALESQHTRWPVFSELTEDYYIASQGYVHFDGWSSGASFSTINNAYVLLKLPEGTTNLNLSPAYFTDTTGAPNWKDTGKRFEDTTFRYRVEPLNEGTADYSKTQFWRFYDAKSDRSVVLPVITIVENAAEEEETVDKLEAYTARAEKLVSTMKQFDEVFDALVDSQNAASVQYGGRHPSDVNLACIVANRIQIAFDITIGWPDSHSYWVEGTGWSTATAADIIKHWTTYKMSGTNKPACNSGDKISQDQVKRLDILLDVVAPYYLNYLENHRIVEPTVTYYAVGGSRGLIDTASKTITLRLPEDTVWNDLPAPTVETNDECQFIQNLGSLSDGQAIATVTPGDRATGTYYNGSDTTGYGFKKNLSQRWTINVEEGTPYTKVLTFDIETADGKVRSARITDGEGGSNGTIKLNLPVGTTLTSLSPKVDYAGEGFYYTVNDVPSDKTEEIDFTQKIGLVVYNTEYETEARYDVSVTAKESAENDILSYKIGDAVGTISGSSVSITIPYATDLTTAEPDITVSEFAEVTQKPAGLQVGENHYTVTAENGAEKDYIVTITRTPVATGRKIKSFRYGGYEATINEGAAEITMTLPKGISPVFAPTIEISEFATVSPASGEVQDFSSPVQYKVTAQNKKASKTYTVTVVISDEAAPNAYIGKLEQIRNNIITRYRSKANDDWEWMDLGFYENRLENYNTSDHAFDIAAKLAKLDTTTNVAMTEFDRTIMMLTARGFNCTKLSQYNDGKPYIDSKGNEIDNLVAALYNYSGEYTINGPIFALLALDMGTYTIPDNARWTRENLINVILDYGNYDEFGIDMVGAIMYSLAPYQEDAVYGAQIKEKLNLCLEIILRKMNSDFSFGAWGATNSESAAWVMMGLCSIGIDWNADPRFSDGQGHSALQHWMDNFANVNGGYFHHTTSVTNNAMATYEGCYATMWYLKFLEEGQGTPCYFYYQRFNFARELSKDASITDFEIEGKKGEINEGGESGENTITVTVPNGMPLTNLTPKVTMAEGATLLAPSLPTTFVEGVKQPFTVLAEDGKTTKTYYVIVNHGDVGAAGAELDVNSIKLQNSVLNATDILEKKVSKASDGATEILLTVNAGVDTSEMYLSASLSYKATANPSLDGKKAMDFSDWQTFTVTSGDGTVQNTYRIKVVSKAQAEITSFRVQAGGEWYNGTIDNARSTITVTGVDDSKLTSTKLVTDIEFTGRTCSPTSGIAVDFANAATFTLGGDNDLASRTYTVTVLNKSGQPISAKSSGGDDNTPTTSTAKITGFSVLGVEGEIDQSAGTITVTLPVGTNVTAVAPVVTVPAGAVVSPVSGEVVNLTSPLTYTVTLGTESKNYTVTVIFERSISQQLWDKVADNSDVADHQTSYGHRFN